MVGGKFHYIGDASKKYEVVSVAKPAGIAKDIGVCVTYRNDDGEVFWRTYDDFVLRMRSCEVDG